MAALLQIDSLFALAASFTGVTPQSIWLTSAEAGVPVEGVGWVAVKKARLSCEL